jgi:hypothetical protein
MKGNLMIHGIYVKNTPKAKWHLVSIAISAEAANYDLDEALKQAKLDGREEAEVGCQIFDSVFWIPQTLTEIKNQKPLYN